MGYGVSIGGSERSLFEKLYIYTFTSRVFDLVGSPSFLPSFSVSIHPLPSLDIRCPGWHLAVFLLLALSGWPPRPVAWLLAGYPLCFFFLFRGRKRRMDLKCLSLLVRGMVYWGELIFALFHLVILPIGARYRPRGSLICVVSDRW